MFVCSIVCTIRHLQFHRLLLAERLKKRHYYRLYVRIAISSCSLGIARLSNGENESKGIHPEKIDQSGRGGFEFDDLISAVYCVQAASWTSCSSARCSGSWIELSLRKTVKKQKMRSMKTCDRNPLLISGPSVSAPPPQCYMNLTSINPEWQKELAGILAFLFCSCQGNWREHNPRLMCVVRKETARIESVY